MRHNVRTVAGLLGVCVTLHACSLNDLVNSSAPPADLIDPKVVQNAEGAVARYNRTISLLTTQMASGGTGQITLAGTGNYIALTGLLTDELEVLFETRLSVTPPFPNSGVRFIDNRSVSNIEASSNPESYGATTTSLFSGLQLIRIQAQEARYALNEFSTTTPRAFIGHLYAIEAFADILLAEVFCSGVPLPTVHFESDYTLTRGFSSEEIYRQALDLLNLARPLSTDSTRILHFVDLTRARAYTGLALYDSAAAVVSAVPDTYQYNLNYSASELNFFLANATWAVSIADREGSNGLDYISSQDPRTAGALVTGPDVVTDLWFPRKYARTGLSPISVASGLQARLVRAEAELQRGDIQAWLATLNQLRTTGAFTVAPNAADPTISDTTWAPGSGASHFPQPFPGLRPLSDPGSDTARVSLLFRERSFWLFLTGQRQGDLRRLVRQYQRPEHQVYPVGYWGPQQQAPYGTDVMFPVPVKEQELNPLYRGCKSYDA